MGIYTATEHLLHIVETENGEQKLLRIGPYNEYGGGMPCEIATDSQGRIYYLNKAGEFPVINSYDPQSPDTQRTGVSFRAAFGGGMHLDRNEQKIYFGNGDTTYVANVGELPRHELLKNMGGDTLWPWESEKLLLISIEHSRFVKGLDTSGKVKKDAFEATLPFIRGKHFFSDNGELCIFAETKDEKTYRRIRSSRVFGVSNRFTYALQSKHMLRRMGG